MQLAHPVIEPALMADEWEQLVAQIERISSVAHYAQIDVMDGHLVPSFSFPYNKTILSDQHLPYAESINFAAHLMVQHPQEVGNRFITAGAKRIVAQVEGFREGEMERVCHEWKSHGVEVGLSVMLGTPLEAVDELVEKGVVTIVQVMSIERVGYQGQEFDARALARISDLTEMYPKLTIAVDGGVNADNIESIREAGADVFGVGSAIMKTENPQRAFAELEQLLSS